MNMRKALRAVLPALPCVPASVVGIVVGYIGGCVAAMILQGILAPGARYDHYSIGTPIGDVVILGPIAVGAAAPWIALGWYMLRASRRERRPADAVASGARREQAIEEQQREAQPNT